MFYMHDAITKGLCSADNVRFSTNMSPRSRHRLLELTHDLAFGVDGDDLTVELQVQRAGLVEYWNSDPKEQAMRTRLRRAEELEYLVSHYQHRIGREEGEAEGLIKGKTEGKAEVASRLLGMGMPVEQIAAATDLTPEQIHGLSYQARV
jgi:hypothetical protein